MSKLLDFLSRPIAPDAPAWDVETVPIGNKPANGKAGALKRDYESSDVGMAERVFDMFGDDFKYVSAWGKFLHWTGKRYVIDNAGHIDATFIKMVRMVKGAASMSGGEGSEKLWKHAHQYEASNKIEAVKQRLQKRPDVCIDPEKLDANSDLINFDNGTLNLKTFELGPHRKADNLTKISPVPYLPDADCGRFLNFLDTIMAGNPALKFFINRAIGYSMTGSTKERCAFFNYGIGCNGKSTLLNVFSEIMGDYAITIRAETLMTSGGEKIRNDIARLKGARFVSAVESEENKRLAESQLKTMTGGTDSLTARFLYGEDFSFKPQFKVWLATNHRPVIRGTDTAIWDRIKLIPFEVRIPDAQLDRNLPEKLRSEYPGILAWMVMGCRDWQRDGLETPKEVMAATTTYRQEMDVLGAFVGECCLTDGDRLQADATPLFETYRQWCAANNEEPMTQRRFGQQLGERGYVSDRCSNTNRKVWKGIGIRK